MKRLVKYELNHGSSIIVEVDVEDQLATDELVPAASPKKLIADAQESFEQALGSIRRTVEEISAQVQDMAEPPVEVSVTFGMKLTGGVNLVLTAGSAEANLTVTVTWKNEKPQAG